MSLPALLTLFSSLSFLLYGVLCLRSPAMRADLERYSLKQFSTAIGVTEIIGALGLIAGLKWPLALAVSSAGLCLTMLVACTLRFKVRDVPLRILPAFFYLVLNGYIFATVISKNG